MRAAARLAGAGALLLLLCTGCWGNVPATGIADVVAVGVSPGTSPDTRAFTFVLPNVTVTSTNLSNVKPASAYKAFHTEQPSLARAVDAIQMQLARKLYLGQLKVVMWSERFGTGDVRDLLDEFNQWGMVSNDFWVATGPDPVDRWLMASPQSQIIVPQYELGDLFECQCLPMALGVRGWQAWVQLHTPGATAVVPWITAPVDTVGQVVAYAPDGRAKLLSDSATRGYAFLTGRMRRGTLTVPTAQGNVSAAVLHGRATARVRREGPDLSVFVTVKVSGRSVRVPWTWTNSQVTQVVAQKVYADCQAALSAIGGGSDPFGWTVRANWAEAVGAGPPATAPWQHLYTHLVVAAPRLMYPND